MTKARRGDALESMDDPGRHESEAQRDDRNLTDLLQELRVAGLGVQVLFGFLLSLPFTTGFSHLHGSQRALYVASLLLAALSTALLCAPVAYHRLIFRRHQKGRLIRAANRLALLGLATVGCAISSAVLLVVSVVDHGAVVPVIAGLTVAVFAGLWFLLPLVARGQVADGRPGSESRLPEDEDA
jgi:ABC-type Fe3+ transport system permease subunit